MGQEDHPGDEEPRGGETQSARGDPLDPQADQVSTGAEPVVQREKKAVLGHVLPFISREFKVRQV